MRTSILSDESASLQQNLQEVQELCSNSMEICGGADENPEDEAAALIAGREDLKKQVKQVKTELVRCLVTSLVCRLIQKLRICKIITSS
jgi:hypothetical protein